METIVVKNEDELRDAVSENDREGLTVKVSVEKKIKCRNRVDIKRPIILYGRGFLEAFEGIRVFPRVRLFEIRNAYVEGNKESGDGIALLARRTEAIGNVVVANCEITKCSDELLVARGVEHVLIRDCVFRDNHRGVMAWKTQDEKEPHSWWSFRVYDSLFLQVDKRLPNTSYQNTVFKRCEIYGWDGDCAKTRDAGQLDYFDCTFDATKANWFDRLLVRFGFDSNRASVVSNASDNTRQIRFHGCKFENGASVKE